jgi:hypothetical protein
MIEEKIFLNELSKRLEKKLEWKYYIEELFSPEIISYSPKQISIIKDLLFSRIPSKNRADFWFIASGAKREMLNNKGYYHSILKDFPEGTQTPAEDILKLDINRTFPHSDYFKIQENKKKLTNILTAFVRRNATIGYSQGFNFIVGKLLCVVDDEEKVFWIFTQIVENYLPGDFYLLFSGVRKDMKVIEKIIKKELNFLDTNIELCISNLISKCFISLFAQNIPDRILFPIWDAFFIHGEIILYRAFIWMAYLHYDKSLKNNDIEDINRTILDKMKSINDINSLYYFLYLYSSVNNNIIKQWRIKIENTTQAETMLNRPFSNDNNIKCDKNKPFCLYNIEENNIEKNKQFLVHKINHEIKYVDNYFFKLTNNNDNSIKNDNKNIKNNTNIEEQLNLNSLDEINISPDSLLIERQKHKCKD